jgi:hypothetical protein
MKRMIILWVTTMVVSATTPLLHSQSLPVPSELGISVGGYSNFPANQHYLDEYMPALYIAPYLRTGKHEFSLGLNVPLAAHGLHFTDNTLSPRPGFIAGYRFYVFNIYGQENMFIHYSLQYLRFKGEVDTYPPDIPGPVKVTETDMYINNTIGLGYNLFFDSDERFSLCYILDYAVSQAGYKTPGAGANPDMWKTEYFWNRISTHIALSFRLTSLNKKQKK